jgi:hypothetical protein
VSSDSQDIAQQVAAGVERALQHADPEQRLRVARAGMTDAIRAEVAQKRTERETTIRGRLFDRRLRQIARDRNS